MNYVYIIIQKYSDTYYNRDNTFCDIVKPTSYEIK